MLRVFWNDAQTEILRKTVLLQKVETHRVPSEFTWSYMYDWEYEHTEGTRYKCLDYCQPQSAVICYPWEAGYAQTSTIADSGIRFTHPWEAGMYLPGDPMPNYLHMKMDRMVLMVWDEIYELRPLSLLQLQESDRFYKTRTGIPTNYYRPDEYSDLMVIYPRPPITFDQLAETDVYSDTGGFVDWLTGSLDTADTGIVIEEVDMENNLLMIFDYIPYDVMDDVGSWYDPLEVPAWMAKYIEYGVLERAYSADTDGRRPSLRDYWMLRKNAGIKMLNMFNSKRMTGRKYVIGKGRAHKLPRHPTLPSAYPRQAR